ncbi:MAG: lanthionine synthetase LanC family protein [Bacteroidota bacterium]
MSYKIQEGDTLYEASVQLLEQLFVATSKVKPSGDSILFDLGTLAFTSVYNHHFGDEKSKAILDEQVAIYEEALNEYSVENPARQTLVGGYLSFGLTYHFLKKYASMEASPYFEENLDEIAFSALEFQLEVGNLDFLYGATGIMQYMLRYTKNKQLLDAAVSMYLKFLYIKKLALEDGIAWEDFYFRHREKKVGINLGLAHGIPGILKILLSIYTYLEHPQPKNISKQLIEGCTTFLKNVAFAENDIAYSYFYIPDVPQDIATVNTRLGWCYGDLSIAIVLHQAGTLMEDAATIAFSKQIIDKAHIRKAQKTTKIEDAGLCHGSAGLCHMYNIFYSYTDKRELLETSRYWLQDTLAQCDSHIKEGTYKKFNPIEKKYEADEGFLEGAAGVGLSLITLLTEDRYWDELLLLNEV